MKLSTIFVVASVSCAVAIKKKHRAKVTPQDISSCTSHVKKFLTGQSSVRASIEAAVDHCALEHRNDDENWICKHYGEGLENAFATEPESRMFTAEDFCYKSEAYMIDLRGATRVANVGSGPLMNFHISPSCEHKVAATFNNGSSTMDAQKAPELWYMMCMNQECAHLLPSKTRWCRTTHQPSHNVNVCDAARKFVQDGVNVIGLEEQMTATELCNVYADFVKEMGHDVQSYQRVVHSDTHGAVPVPDDAARALGSSQMVNNAGSHHLRDNSGHHSSAVRAVGALRDVAAAICLLASAITVTS